MKIIRKIVEYFQELWNRILRWFSTRYTIQISYDSHWGNLDDQEYKHVRKIIKSNFKEIKFRTEDRREVHIRDMNGLKYRIEEE